MYNRVRTRKGMLNNTYIILYVHERVFVRGRTFCAWHIFFTTLFFFMRCTNSIISHRFKNEFTSSSWKHLHNWYFSRVLYSSLISSLVYLVYAYALYVQQKDLAVYKNQSISRSLSNLIFYFLLFNSPCTASFSITTRTHRVGLRFIEM